VAVILVVDDEAQVLDLVCTALTRAGHHAVAATTGQEAVDLAPRIRPALLLLDLKLADPAMDGLAVFTRIRADLPGVIGVMMTGFGTLPHACESGRAGIAAYIAKPFVPDELLAVVNGALAKHGRPPARAPDEPPDDMPTAAAFDSMIGASEAMQHVFRWIVRSAPLDVPVLICGETGTGKELVARSIHRRSARADGPFVDVNCSAVPTTLFESEFFGHERGAFTDAREAKPGFFERAHGGTLFLDEVGDLALEAQAKLLRVIDQGEVLPLGARRPTPIDVRIVAATNVDLVAAIARETFRKDLYWRLNGFSVRLPPVRERAGDVALLIDEVFERTRVALRRPDVRLLPGARQALLDHDWPRRAFRLHLPARDVDSQTPSGWARLWLSKVGSGMAYDAVPEPCVWQTPCFEQASFGFLASRSCCFAQEVLTRVTGPRSRLG